MPIDDPLFRRLPDALEARLGPEEVVLLSPGGERYLGLDGVACDVWAALEAPARRSEVAERLAVDYDAPAARIAEDLVEMFALLEAEGLIERTPDAA